MGNRTEETRTLKERVNTFNYQTNNLNQYTTQTKISIKVGDENEDEKEDEDKGDDDEKQESSTLTGTLLYDNNGNITGNLLENKRQYIYSYDYKNRLVKIEKNIYKKHHKKDDDKEDKHKKKKKHKKDKKKKKHGDNEKEEIKTIKIVEIQYDVLGRRIEKKFNNGSYRKYYYSNRDIILEENYDKNQRLKNQKYFTYGNSVDDILSVEITKFSKKGEAKKPKRYFYQKDNLGSIIAISNEKAKIIEEYAYDVFGKPYTKKKNGKITKLKKSKIGNTRMYTGREYDRGLKLYYNRARYYNPKLGRFISRDPIDIVDDVNLYAYVGNNGVMFVDRMGLEKVLILITIDKKGIIPKFDKNGFLTNTDEFTGQSFNTLIKKLKKEGKKYDTKIISNFYEFDFQINEKTRESIYLIGHGSKGSITLNSDTNISKKTNGSFINKANLSNDTQNNDLSDTILYLYSCNTGRDGNKFFRPDPIGERIQNHYEFKETYAPDTFIWGYGQIYNNLNPINWASNKIIGEPIIYGEMIKFN